MANGENLGTCDLSARFHENTPHPKIKTCVNWREQTAQGETSRCPTCGSHRQDQRLCIAWKTGGMPQAEKLHLPNTEACEECFDAYQNEPHGVPSQPSAEEKPLVCRNPNHFHTDGSPSEHEIGPSCMAEPSSPPATACKHVFSKQSGCCLKCDMPEYPESGATAGTAREFYEKHKTNVVNVPRIGHPEDKSGWDGVRRASLAKFIAPDVEVMPIWDACEFAEAYAADLVRQAQATKQMWVDEYEHARKRFVAAEAAVAQLRQELEDDEQMWRERCDAASKAGYEVAMEQEREARERAERALGDREQNDADIARVLRKCEAGFSLLATSGNQDCIDTHREIRRALAQVKSSEGEAK